MVFHCAQLDRICFERSVMKFLKGLVGYGFQRVISLMAAAEVFSCALSVSADVEINHLSSKERRSEPEGRVIAIHDLARRVRNRSENVSGLSYLPDASPFQFTGCISCNLRQ